MYIIVSCVFVFRSFFYTDNFHEMHEYFLSATMLFHLQRSNAHQLVKFMGEIRRAYVGRRLAALFAHKLFSGRKCFPELHVQVKIYRRNIVYQMLANVNSSIIRSKMLAETANWISVLVSLGFVTFRCAVLIFLFVWGNRPITK